jgi:hypothetical protein
MVAGPFDCQPDDYRAHRLHSEARTYGETNCYTDIIIEMLHARGAEPLACLGATARLDFEGDQWTFFKPSPEDLELLYGVDIHEMQPAASLPSQIATLLDSGRTMTVELDAYFLPDTAATSYRREHVKTSVIAASIDEQHQRFVYFHNAGLYELHGDDYREVFRRNEQGSPVLPPYAEIVRFDAGERLVGDALRSAARARLRRHLAMRPDSDPFKRFAAHLSDELPRLLSGNENDYHRFAFATVRMAGAGFELLAEHVDWMFDTDAAQPLSLLRQIVDGCKLVGFKLARRRPFEFRPLLSEMSDQWRDAMAALDDVVA